MGTVQTPVSQIPLGQTLLVRGIVSQDQLNIALTEQKRFKAPLGKVLVMLGFVTEATIRDLLSETLGQVSIDLTNTIVDPSAIAMVPKDMARRYTVLPVSFDPDRTRADPRRGRSVERRGARPDPRASRATRSASSR
jgi:hypothetical protein